VGRCNPVVSQWVIHALVDGTAALIPDAVVLRIQVVEKLYKKATTKQSSDMNTMLTVATLCKPWSIKMCHLVFDFITPVFLGGFLHPVTLKMDLPLWPSG